MPLDGIIGTDVNTCSDILLQHHCMQAMNLDGGTSAMPAYASILSEQEIVAVLDFIKSTWPAEMRQYQWEVTQQAQQ